MTEGGAVLQPLTVTVGATVPTGFEHTAAEEVQEKIGASARISKERGRIYFEVNTDLLPKVGVLQPQHHLFSCWLGFPLQYCWPNSLLQNFNWK